VANAGVSNSAEPLPDTTLLNKPAGAITSSKLTPVWVSATHPGLAAAEAHHGLSGVAQSAGEKQPQPGDEQQGQQPGKKNLRKDTLPGEGIFHVGRIQLRDQGG
jgi:hypothetical protein